MKQIDPKLLAGVTGGNMGTAGLVGAIALGVFDFQKKTKPPREAR